MRRGERIVRSLEGRGLVEDGKDGERRRVVTMMNM